MCIVGMRRAVNKDGVALDACQQIRGSNDADAQFFAGAPPGMQCVCVCVCPVRILVFANAWIVAGLEAIKRSIRMMYDV